MNKKKVAIIGCTGMAGQQFVEGLNSHPWFEIESLHGVSSTGYSYQDKRRGFSSFNQSDEIEKMIIKPITEIDYENIDLIFSAVPGDNAKKIEGKCAQRKPVFSTASYFRYQEDVPIFLPIINGNHYHMLENQKKNRNWEGYVCPGPNCTTVGLSISTFPIFQKFGIKTLHMVSLQAISGAGYPGVPSYDILGNVIPHIPQEEEKIKKEVKKIFSSIRNGQFYSPSFLIDAKCNRVPVINGHVESIFIETEHDCSVNDIMDCLNGFRGDTKGLDLPNAPDVPIKVFDSSEPFRPQPRIDLSNENNSKNGMMTFVGGIEETSFKNGFKFTVLAHNTELGAGRGGILSAEYLFSKNMI